MKKRDTEKTIDTSVEELLKEWFAETLQKLRESSEFEETLYQVVDKYVGLENLTDNGMDKIMDIMKTFEVKVK